MRSLAWLTSSSHASFSLPPANAASSPDPRLGMLEAFPQFVPDCCAQLMSLLMDVYSSSANSDVREKCLLAFRKMIYYSSAEDLKVYMPPPFF